MLAPATNCTSVLLYVLFRSLKDRGGNTGDPKQEGGSAKEEGRQEEKARTECCKEKTETRRAQVSWPWRELSFWHVPCFTKLKRKILIFPPHRKKSLEGIKRKYAEEDSEVEDPGMQEGQAAAVESDDEVEYYRQAVGEEPDEGEYDECTINIWPLGVVLIQFIDQELFCADMFPSAKKRKSSEYSNGPSKKRKLSPGKSLRKDKDSSLPNSPGGQHREKPRKGWKKSGDGEKPFGKKIKLRGKTFKSKKPGDMENKFGGKKKGGSREFSNKNKDKSFNLKGQKGRQGFKKRGAEAKRSFKQRKGKG